MVSEVLPPSPPSRRVGTRILIREAPWLVAVAVSTGLIWAAIPALDHPAGSNWPIYFQSAAYFWDPTAAYSEWRTPLFPLALATLGDAMGYVAAAHRIALLSVAALVLGAAGIARCVSGPVAGAVAALCVPMLQCAVEMGTWSNMYPMAAGTCALALAAGAATARWPTIGGAALAGLLAGLAWKLNHLGLLAVPVVIGLGILGADRLQGWIRRGLLLGAIGLGLGSAAGLNHWVVQHWRVPQAEMQVQVLQRRREELERIRDSRDQSFSACIDLEPKPLNLAELSSPCARQFFGMNWGTLRSEDCAPPPWTMLGLMALSLLPAGWAAGRREAWRSSLSMLVLVGGPAAAFILGALWTAYAEKYMVVFVPLMAALLPVAGARLGTALGRLGGHPVRGRWLGLGLAVLVGVFHWPRPTGLYADAPRLSYDWEAISGDAARWAKANVGPEDLLLDCVPLRVDLAMLPTKIPQRYGVGTQEPCSGWILTPPEASGRIYMLTRTYPKLPHTDPQEIASSGWLLLRSFDATHHLWVRQASDAAE
jgi:hypothetical protein